MIEEYGYNKSGRPTAFIISISIPDCVCLIVDLYIRRLSGSCCGLAVFGEVGVVHVAGFVECAVEFECCLKSSGGLSAFAEVEIIEEQTSVERVCAVVDNLVSSFDRIFVAQVCDALVCDEDVDGVFAVVGVCDHRHDVANQATFRNRGAAENRNVGIAGKVA